MPAWLSLVMTKQNTKLISGFLILLLVMTKPGNISIHGLLGQIFHKWATGLKHPSPPSPWHHKTYRTTRNEDRLFPSRKWIRTILPTSGFVCFYGRRLLGIYSVIILSLHFGIWLQYIGVNLCLFLWLRNSNVTRTYVRLVNNQWHEDIGNQLECIKLTPLTAPLRYYTDTTDSPIALLNHQN